MLSLLKKDIFKSTMLYTITDCISKGIGFLILPLVTYYIVPEQMGIVSNFDVLQQILTLLAGQAIVNALPYFYYGRKKEDVAKWVSNVLLIVLICNLLFSLIIICTTNIIQNYLYITLSLQLLTIVSGMFLMIQNMNLILYRLEEKPLKFCYFQLGHVAVQVSLVVLLVMVLKMEAVGKILSVVGAHVTLGLIHFIQMYKRHYIVFKFDKPAIKDALHFGIPLLPHSLSFWIKGGMDKVMLTTFCGLAVNGLYSMALTFGAMFSILNTAFSNSFVPYLQKRLSLMTPDNERLEKKKIVKMSYQIGIGFIFIGGLVVGLCWLAINYILDSKYIPSFEFIPYIILSQVIYVFYNLTIQYPYSVKRTMGLGAITFSCSLLQLLATYICVSNFGKDGIKISIIIGSVATCLGVWIYSNKVYPMPWLTFWKRK